MDAISEIKKLYYTATRATIARDLARAVTLLKTLPTEEDRQRAAVYMDGLAQMRGEWTPPFGRAQGKGQRAMETDEGTKGGPKERR